MSYASTNEGRPYFMTLEHTPAEGVVCTKSRLRAWWMRRFRGYTIDSVRKTPVSSWFGRIRYEIVWVLRSD